MIRLVSSVCLALAAVSLLELSGHAESRTGEQIYQDLCIRCHGAQGQGVAGKSDEPLYGTRSVASLTRIINTSMPEDEPELCVDEDAAAVAAYIHETFYSPQARARMRPPRVELARLTTRQYRESVADLVGSFGSQQPPLKSGGLRAEYFQSDGMNKKAKKVISREDEKVAFDFKEQSPGEGITADQFSIAWQGSLLAPDTGFYEMRLRTPNGARLYFNVDLKSGDANSRDDSAARRQTPSLDLWVSSGGEMREATMRVFLLGGRSYPLRLDFFKYKEKTASVSLEWKPPNGEWATPGKDHFSPETAAPVTVVSTVFPPDDGSLGYERGSAVSKVWQEAITAAAIEVANQILARLPHVTGVSDKDEDAASKYREFAAQFAERAFRRPLAEDLRREYVDQKFEMEPNPEIALKRVLLLVLNSPRFLYPELGAPPDAYAAASRLALALWDSLPDQALWQAAQKGELLTRESVRAHAQRMLADNRAKEKLREFFHHWLEMEQGEDLSKDTEAFPGFDSTLVADLRASLEFFLEEVVWSEPSNFRELLLADYLYMNSRLADFYGVEFPADQEGFQRVMLDETQRAGVLTHPFVLSMLSYHRSTSPIHRGVFLTRNVLGRFLKPPPMAISFMDDRFDPTLTMREKVTELTKSPTCMGCHVTINPLGFSLEHFDAVGRWRTTDNNKPVNAESDYADEHGQVVRLRGPRDVADHAAGNNEARRGFVRQLFQYTVKQAPAAYGPDTLQGLDTLFADSNCHIRNLFVDIATTAALHNPDTQTQASR